MSYKVAVIIRGEPREAEYTYKNIKWALGDLDCKFFFHLWTTKTNARFETLEVTHSRLSPAFEYLDADVTWHYKEDLDTDNALSYVSNCMFGMWEYSGKYLNEYECKNDVIFDYVISMRPDILITKKITNETLSNMRSQLTIHTDGWTSHTPGFDGGFAPDNFLLGRRFVMNQFQYVKSWAAKHVTDANIIDTTHNVLYDFFMHKQIIEESDPGCVITGSPFCFIVRPGYLDKRPLIEQTTEEIKHEVNEHNKYWWIEMEETLHEMASGKNNSD